ncbi:MAG TPA: hypothetical protein VGN92_12295, partial [Mycobacterium sp.]|nr:hypothetical protein [Mycobacterium sp.]
MSPTMPTVPSLQFRPCGLTEPDLPARWLSGLDADMEYVTGVWLGPIDGGRYCNVGTFERQHFDETHGG